MVGGVRLTKGKQYQASLGLFQRLGILIFRPFLQFVHGCKEYTGFAPECAGTFGFAARCVPFIETLILDNPPEHRKNLVIGFPDKTILDQRLNHPSAEPGPVASVLITIRIHAHILE